MERGARYRGERSVKQLLLENQSVGQVGIEGLQDGLFCRFNRQRGHLGDFVAKLYRFVQ